MVDYNQLLNLLPYWT